MEVLFHIKKELKTVYSNTTNKWRIENEPAGGLSNLAIRIVFPIASLIKLVERRQVNKSCNQPNNEIRNLRPGGFQNNGIHLNLEEQWRLARDVLHTMSCRVTSERVRMGKTWQLARSYENWDRRSHHRVYKKRNENCKYLPT